jgi:hypothetical protein
MQLPRRSATFRDLAEKFVLAYEFQRHLLQPELDALPLAGALERLHLFHEISGFAADTRAGVEQFRFRDPRRAITLRAEFNPRRRLRRSGSGRNQPPPGFVAVNNGCFLAAGNVVWQQAGRQSYYRRHFAGAAYHFLEQPFPFARLHYTIAAAGDAPQDWRPSLGTLGHRIRVMHAIESELPEGFAVLYNGAGAGSSIDWEHYHLLDAGRLPIQDAFAAGVEWPLNYRRLEGGVETIAAEAERAAVEWQNAAGERASENIAMVREGGDPVCYYIPRHRDRERVDPKIFSGAIGAYESTGVFVFESDEEGQALREGRMGFDLLWWILELAGSSGGLS